MEIASAVFQHNFDKAMLEQIDTLRTVRLQMAEKMLREIDNIAHELNTRGLVGPQGVDKAELRAELTSRIKTMQERLKRPDVIYSDEISLYVDLLADAEREEADESEEDGDEA